MNNKTIYIAYILQSVDGFASNLLRYAFEHPSVEYYAEPEEQAQLKAYFKAHHYTHEEPLVVEPSDILDYMPYSA